MLFAELLCNFARAKLRQHIRQSLPQPRSFAADSRPHGNEEQHYEQQQESIDDRNRASAAVQKPLQIRNNGTHEISKENGEQECNQSLPRCIQKTEAQGKQQHRHQYPRRACVNHRQSFFPNDLESDAKIDPPSLEQLPYYRQGSLLASV